MVVTKVELEALLKKHNVPGVSVAIISGGKVHAVAAGVACRETSEMMRPHTWLQIASCSKTFAAMFAVQYFSSKGVALDTCVNVLLKAAGSPFQLRAASGKPKSWGDEVTLRHLMDHTALGMHYVNGVPLSRPLPPVLDLISGRHSELGYDAIYVHKKPGLKFDYSGGGFLVLQHLIEVWEGGKPLSEVIAPFVRAVCSRDELSFAHAPVAGAHYATGHRDDGSAVQDGRLMFPPLAAGGMGTARALAAALCSLSQSYAYAASSVRQGGADEQPLSRAHAREILTSEDKGSVEFMGAAMGLGTFVADAHLNRFAIHQAANDGFRGVYLVCFDGPDAMRDGGAQGFVILNNGDNQGTLLNCALTRLLLERMEFSGVDFSRVADTFDAKNLRQEVIVNLGLKQLVFDAFMPRPSGGAAARSRL